jgi:multicomponent Na+:H+ antiporter subunit G
MILLQHTLSIVFVVLGILFIFAGSIGILRLPDFYSRTHSISKSDTLGVIFVIIGLVIYEGLTQSSLKLVFIALFIALSNPIGSHALSRAALKKGIKPLLGDDIQKSGGSK